MHGLENCDYNVKSHLVVILTMIINAQITKSINLPDTKLNLKANPFM